MDRAAQAVVPAGGVSFARRTFMLTLERQVERPQIASAGHSHTVYFRVF